MKIAVCMKRVPDTATRLNFAQDGTSIDTSEVQWVISPYDEYAIEEALRIREQIGEGSVTAISVGPESSTKELRKALGMGADDAVLARALRDFEDGAASDKARHESALFARQHSIARLTDAATVAEFHERLARQAETDDWFAHGARAIAGASPLSLAVVHRQLSDDPKLSIEQVFKRELAMAIACTRRPDFAEGIRALLVDKDKNPQWTPTTLDAVTSEQIAAHFTLPDDYAQHPLADL